MSPSASVSTAATSTTTLHARLLSYFDAFFQRIDDSPLAPWKADIAQALTQRIGTVNHGDLPGWLAALDNLPPLQADDVELNRDCLHIAATTEPAAADIEQLEHSLRTLMPWRKGPYQVFNIHIDTEWRSDLKWQRLQPHIADLHNRRILDIGCGNGYHCWRMHAAGAREVTGIDPSWKFLLQFQALKHYIGDCAVELLPLGIEQLPRPMPVFDTVFSMGVFYHRRSPFDHLLELKDLLRPGGELVLETLVIDGDEHSVLVPGERYAQMRNVWFLPSCKALENWLQRAGFNHIRCVDISRTTTEEQRATDWMRYHSLADFLDRQDPSLTVEGYPAPTRAVFIAQKPF